MPIKPTHKVIIDALRAGGRLWLYSTQNRAHLSWGAHEKQVNRATVEDMEAAGLIEEDDKASVYRFGSGSDIHYRLVVDKA